MTLLRTMLLGTTRRVSTPVPHPVVHCDQFPTRQSQPAVSRQASACAGTGPTQSSARPEEHLDRGVKSALDTSWVHDRCWACRGCSTHMSTEAPGANDPLRCTERACDGQSCTSDAATPWHLSAGPHNCIQHPCLRALLLTSATTSGHRPSMRGCTRMDRERHPLTARRLIAKRTWKSGVSFQSFEPHVRTPRRSLPSCNPDGRST